MRAVVGTFRHADPRNGAVDVHLSICASHLRLRPAARRRSAACILIHVCAHTLWSLSTGRVCAHFENLERPNQHAPVHTSVFLPLHPPNPLYQLLPVALHVQPAERGRHGRQVADGLDLVLPEPQLLIMCGGGGDDVCMSVLYTSVRVQKERVTICMHTCLSVIGR